MNSELDVTRTSADELKLSRGKERELSAIVTDMWRNAENLLRAELDLGLSELDMRVEKLERTLLLATIRGAIFYAGFLLLLAAAVLGLSEVMAPWLSALLLGSLAIGVGLTWSLRGDEHAAPAPKTHQVPSSSAPAMKEAIK